MPLPYRLTRMSWRFLKDFNFDALGINYVTAIEQIFPVTCDGACADIANHPQPWDCTHGIVEMVLHAYESKANFNETTRLFPSVAGDAAEPTAVSAIFHPGDTVLAYRTDTNPLNRAFLKLGANANSRLRIGSVAVRNIYAQEDREVGPITMRFHTMCEPPPPEKQPQSAFLFSSNVIDPQPPAPLEFSEGLQVHTVRISDTNMQHFIQTVNGVEHIEFLHLGVVGHHWLTGYQVLIVRENGLTELVQSDNNWHFYGRPLALSNVRLKQGRRDDFYVSLSQYRHPPASTFSTAIFPMGPFPSDALPGKHRAPCRASSPRPDVIPISS